MNDGWAYRIEYGKPTCASSPPWPVANRSDGDDDAQMLEDCKYQTEERQTGPRLRDGLLAWLRSPL